MPTLVMFWDEYNPFRDRIAGMRIENNFDSKRHNVRNSIPRNGYGST
ncbi:hypothetical protein KR51_00014160 [Rubidibacter lacunae KORDI 51-2]|uniref:Uncharacterized protein n=1 Tax=Rubidibacter lacunae KORDI 51-2 TaxID=582515 RepID=U5DQX5_9CHRO|nr:hypothetical protein KR51_00014160 [Rubidibacter lacunae KORDI 51-2]